MSEQSFKSELVRDRLGNALMNVSYTDVDGMTTEKTLSLDDYLMILGNSTFSNRNSCVRIGVLPFHYYDGSISTEDAATFNVILFYKEEKRAVSFGGKHWFVPFPAMVFHFKVLKGNLQWKNCYAVTSDDVNPDMSLMQYPFGNVSAAGAICMGNIQSGRIENICQIEDVVADFFMSETDNDYYASKNSTGLKQEQLLEKLSKLEHFPIEWLAPSSGGCSTLLDLSNKL